MNFDLTSAEPGMRTASETGSCANHDESATCNGSPPQEAPRQETLVDTLVVADSQLAFSELLAVRLQEQGLCRLSETAATVDDAVHRVTGCPDVLVLADVHIPGGGISGLIDRCRAAGDTVRFAILSNPLSPLQRALCFRLPIVGMANKHLPLSQLLAELQHLAHRKELLNSRPEWRPEITAREDGPEAVIGQLNPRQYQVLLLLAEGLSVKLVAQRLKVSVKTVDSLKYRLMKQLQFHDRVELTRFAIREGLIDP